MKDLKLTVVMQLAKSTDDEEYRRYVAEQVRTCLSKNFSGKVTVEIEEEN